MMEKTWNILYRASLLSCNYACVYCPFAKTKNTSDELLKDAQQLKDFKQWVKVQNKRIGMLFTPWGEALIHKYYQDGLIELSHMPNVYRIAIQTNLSCNLDWMNGVNKDSFALWTTFHPSQTSLDQFVAKCERLQEMNIRFSVGTVGIKEDIEVIGELRSRLSQSIYLWVNAYKREDNYYTESEISSIQAIDPYFHWNNQWHPSLDKPCRAGHTSFAVDGDGNMTSCHFIKEKIGNIYQENFEQALKPRTCVNDTCKCHIGYVHLDELKQDLIYGDGILERIPLEFST